MTIGIDDGRGAHTEAGHRVLDLVLTDQDWMVQHVEQSLCAKMLLRVSMYLPNASELKSISHDM